MTTTEHVILVDENDNPIGTAEKLDAHLRNLRHRAFSVFILRKTSQIEVLLQQRANGKYHSPNLWTNTCCSHPRPGEAIIDAGKRRLQEEMGMQAELANIGRFNYIAHFDNGLVENEVDYVLTGLFDGKEPLPNPNEVQNFRWISISDLDNELATQPQQFTPWLKQALELVKTCHPESVLCSKDLHP
jgi:isopentenyl-diphosphate delta-isomerase